MYDLPSGSLWLRMGMRPAGTHMPHAENTRTTRFDHLIADGFAFVFRRYCTVKAYSRKPMGHMKAEPCAKRERRLEYGNSDTL